MAGQILIVDDHEVVRRGIRSILSARPEWKICGEAADGLEAVERAKALRPDVVLMDVSMPRMDGLEATRIIRKSLPASKVVIVSQNDPNVVIRQVREVGAAAFVAKSHLAQNLLSTLDKLVEVPEVPAETNSVEKSEEPTSGWLSGGGELGRLIRGSLIWSLTPLGPVERLAPVAQDLAQSDSQLAAPDVDRVGP